MKDRLLRRPQAKRDVIEIGRYIAEDSLPTAIRFIRAARADMRKLAEMPGMGARREFSNPRLKDLRSWPISGFRNYLIFYLPITGGIEVIRVLHGARDLKRIFDR